MKQVKHLDVYSHECEYQDTSDPRPSPGNNPKRFGFTERASHCTGRRRRALQINPIEGLEERITPDSTFWAGVGGFIQGANNGLYNIGAGVVNLGHEVVTMPIDLVGTAVSSTYQPISYYGQGSQAAQQNGTPWYSITGQTALNAGTLGTYGLASTGYQYDQTGDPTAFQQTTGAFVFTVGVFYYASGQVSTANNPTYNLGGTGEVPGAINVQPPGAAVPPDPALLAPSGNLPIGPGSGHVVVNNAPIAPEGGGWLGPGYDPVQIVSIAEGGNTITISAEVEVPGTPTPGQQAVIAAAPPGSQVSISPNGPFGTTVTIVTPTPWPVVLIPYAPLVGGGAMTNPIATTPASP